MPPVEQLMRRNENAFAKAKRYPEPPKYRPSYEYPPPTQPACYTFQSL